MKPESKKAPDIGGLLAASVPHFYSGQPLLNLSGVDTPSPTVQKWGRGNLRAGFTIFPNVIIERQKDLGLDPIDVNILMHLVVRWWRADELPTVSKRTIALAVGVSPRTVQRHITKLEKLGLVRRYARRPMSAGVSRQAATNIYDLSGLAEAALPLAKLMTRERAQKRKERRLKSQRSAQLEDFSNNDVA